MFLFYFMIGCNNEVLVVYFFILIIKWLLDYFIEVDLYLVKDFESIGVIFDWLLYSVK